MKSGCVCFLILSLLAVARDAAGAVPTIVKVDPQENTNRAAFQTATFSEAATYQYHIWRRGGIASIKVEVSADFSDTTHEIAVEVSNTFKPTPLLLTLSPSAVAPAAGPWALQYGGTAVVAGKKIVQLSLQVADAAGVGQYALNAVMRRKGQTAALGQMAFPKPVVVLFNPWSERDSVFMEDDKGRKECVNDGNGRYRTEVDNRDRTWRYGQFDAVTLQALLKMLTLPRPAVPEEQMTSTVRSDPIKFSRAMAESIGKYVEGDWVLETFGPGETSPRKWNDSTQLFAKFGTPPVKYARCWVYANMLTSLFRCAGLPARPVSCIKSAHERFPTDGFVDLFEVKKNGNWVVDTDVTRDTAWGFHAWTEAWMTRPDRQNCDGWQAVDGTYGTGPAPVKAVAAKSAGDFEVDSFTTAVGAPIRFWRNGKIDRTDNTSIGKKILTKKAGAAADDDIVRNYKPAALAAPSPVPSPGLPVVVWTIPESAPIGHDVAIIARLSNPGPFPTTIDVTVSAYAECYDQTSRADVWLPESRQIALPPATADHAEVFTIPWTSYQSLGAVSDHLRVDAFAVCDALDAGWPAIAYVVFGAPALSVARTSSALIGPADFATFTISLQNTGAVPLPGCEVTLQPLGAIGAGAPEVIGIGALSPGASMSWSRSYPAASIGEGQLAAQIVSDTSPAWSAADSVTVSACRCDLTQDGVVDDQDFLVFLPAYELLIVPPADPLCDITGDTLVDDADFVVFVAAYDRLLCLTDPE